MSTLVLCWQGRSVALSAYPFPTALPTPRLSTPQLTGLYMPIDAKKRQAHAQRLFGFHPMRQAVSRPGCSPRSALDAGREALPRFRGNAQHRARAFLGVTDEDESASAGYLDALATVVAIAARAPCSTGQVGSWGHPAPSF